MKLTYLLVGFIAGFLFVIWLDGQRTPDNTPPDDEPNAVNSKVLDADFRPQSIAS
jgi:hypothetical protein